MSRCIFRVAMAAWLLLSGGASAQGAAPLQADYREEMAALIEEIHDYAQTRHPGFGLLPNGGLALYQAGEGSGDTDTAGSRAGAALLAAVDGVLAESVFYRWETGEDGAEGFRATTAKERRTFDELLAAPKRAGKPIFVIDYCDGRETWQDARRQNAKRSYVGYAAPRRALDVIPRAPVPDASDADVRSLQDAKNFLALLNPGRYHSREQYLAALSRTGYDLLIIDLCYGGEPLTAAEVARLQKKPGGARRQVYAYLSVGEAESYRPYWQPKWREAPPGWLAAPNEDWPGSYRVRYWHPAWKAILYGSPDAYLDRILAAGFDGAFLDVVDAYAGFEFSDSIINEASCD